MASLESCGPGKAVCTLRLDRLSLAAIAGADPARTLSAIDAASLASLLIMLTAELIVLAFSLWLLFRVYRSVPAKPEPIAGEHDDETSALLNENN